MDRAESDSQVERAHVSSIPFNTVASVLGTNQAQRQAAASLDKNVHDAARSEKLQSQLNRDHIEQVEDSAQYGVVNVRDEGGGKNRDEEQPGRRKGERVEIAGVETEKTDAADGGLTAGSAADGRLDISA